MGREDATAGTPSLRPRTAVPSIAVDRCTAAELQAMSGHELMAALNEVLAAIADTARLSASARDALSNAKLGVLQAKTGDERDAFKALKIKAETTLAKVRDRAQTLKLQTTVLQTLIRAAASV